MQANERSLGATQLACISISDIWPPDGARTGVVYAAPSSGVGGSSSDRLTQREGWAAAGTVGWWGTGPGRWLSSDINGDSFSLVPRAPSVSSLRGHPLPESWQLGALNTAHSWGENHCPVNGIELGNNTPTAPRRAALAGSSALALGS